MKNLLLASAAVMNVFAFGASSAFAQDPFETQDLEETFYIPEEDGANNAPADEVVVTGSRLARGAESEAVRSIDSLEIEERGITTIEQLLRQVSVNAPTISSSQTGGINGTSINNRGNFFINLSGGSAADLRGIGAGSTLVLVNGRRIAGEGAASGDFADISNIAIESIERVDILTSGASAVYGADAVAGVINIILKKDYTGTTVTARYGNSASGADDIRLSATSGFNWDGGNLTVSGGYNKIDAVDVGKFGVKTLDLRDQGGSDLRSFTSTRGVFSLRPDSVEFADPDDFFTNNAYLLPLNSGPIDANTDIGVFEQVSRDSLTERLPTSFAPDSETFSISARFNQDINSTLVDNVFVDASYATRSTSTQVEAPEIFLSTFDFAFGEFGIPFPNSDEFGFSPYREDINFRLDGSELVDAGLLSNNNFDTKGENYAIAGGFTGSFSDDWRWEASASYSRNDDTDVDTAFVSTDLYAGIFDFETFDFIAPPENIIRNDFATDPNFGELVTNATRTRTLVATSEQTQLLGIVYGKFLQGRETGSLDVSFGVDHRIESNKGITTIARVGDIVDDRRDIDGGRKSTGLFAEASIPMSDRFVLNGALRYEDVTNTGETTTVEEALADYQINGGFNFDPIPGNTPFEFSSSGFSPRLGAAWTPIDAVKFRATVGRSYRAPNAREVGEPTLAQSGFAPTLTESGIVLNDFDRFTGELAPGSIDAPEISGGNPDLKREIAKTRNLGANVSIPIKSGSFGFDVDYWTIDYEDRIGGQGLRLGGNFFRDIPANEIALGRDDAGNIISIRPSGPTNISQQDLAGVDLKFFHQWSKGSTFLDTQVALSKQTKNRTQVTPDAETIDRLGKGSTDLRWNAVSTLTMNKVILTGVLNYTGEYTLIGLNPDTFEDVEREIDSFVTLDLQAQYKLPKSLGLASGSLIKVGATNIFNEDPPFLNDFNGFDASNYDLRRRVLYVEVSKSF